VSAVPGKLLTPSVVTPARSGAATVQAAGVYAGPQVYLYVNKTLRSHVDAVAATATLPAGSPPLVADNSLTVQQAICAAISGLSAPAIVTPAPVKPLAPTDLVPKNGAAFVATGAYLPFKDPGSGTPAANTQAYFLVYLGVPNHTSLRRAARLQVAGRHAERNRDSCCVVSKCGGDGS
jgi:hypothetical protein